MLTVLTHKNSYFLSTIVSVSVSLTDTLASNTKYRYRYRWGLINNTSIGMAEVQITIQVSVSVSLNARWRYLYRYGYRWDLISDGWLPPSPTHNNKGTLPHSSTQSLYIDSREKGSTQNVYACTRAYQKWGIICNFWTKGPIFKCLTFLESSECLFQHRLVKKSKRPICTSYDAE